MSYCGVVVNWYCSTVLVIPVERGKDSGTVL